MVELFLSFFGLLVRLALEGGISLSGGLLGRDRGVIYVRVLGSGIMCLAQVQAL